MEMSLDGFSKYVKRVIDDLSRRANVQEELLEDTATDVIAAEDSIRELQSRVQQLEAALSRPSRSVLS